MSHTTRCHRAAEPPEPCPIHAGQHPACALRTAAGLLIAGLLLAGCGASDPERIGTAGGPAELPPSAPSWAPATPPLSGPGPTAAPAPDPASPAAVRLPWPAADPATAAELQRSVDGGSEPWLLDPAEVAISYATAAHGWTGAAAQPRPDGTTVDVSDGGRKLTLSLAQPGRPGAGGIWVVTGETGG